MPVSPGCIAAVRGAVGDKLTEQEAKQVIERVEAIQKRQRAEGQLDRAEERLRQAAMDEADKAKLEAALQAKHAARNVFVRQEVEAFIDAYTAVRPGKIQDAVLSYMEGSNRQFEGARASVAATALAYERMWHGAILGAIAKEKPHIEKMLGEEAFNGRVAVEMGELKEGGQPGKTGDRDAKWLADRYAEVAELSRRELNRLGANIGKLEGWRPQRHDNWRLLRAGRSAWVRAIRPLLDEARSFPDASPEEVGDILGGIWDTIVTGRDESVTAREKGQVTGPANLAKKLGEHRVLHFRDTEAWLTYNKAFGYGNLSASMFSHLQRAAKLAGQMERLGPNPQAMMLSLVESLQRKIKDSFPEGGPAAERAKKEIDGLRNIESWGAWGIMTGLTSAPRNYSAAAAGSFWRAWQATSKLGLAVISSITDPVTLVNNLRFQGKGFLSAYAKVFGGYFRGRGKDEQRHVAFLLGEGFQGIIDQQMTRYAILDTPPGWMSRGMTTFFRWSGLTGFTDTGRAVAARVMAADMGSHARMNWAELPERYRMTLERQGIGEAKWEAVREAAWQGENGAAYLTPDRIKDLPDEVIDRVIADRIADARAKVKNPVKLNERIARLRRDARQGLELDLHRFYADEAAFGIIEVDAASRRLTMLGTQERPGTFGGEMIRAIMQFKGFPIAFTQRVLGRALFAGPKGLARWAHIGELMAGLFVAGLFAMWGKDVAKGKSPRELVGDDGLNWRTLGAAFVQSGGAGIYGDFLFAEVNRFGGTPLESLAGPAFGEASQFLSMVMRAKDGDVRAADWLNFVLRNTPFANLHAVRPGLDYLFLNSLREAISPGFLGRQEQRARQEGGQAYWIPRTAF